MDELRRLITAVEGVVLGKPRAVRLAVCCLAARGHLLIEDIPGVGKTTLATALAHALGLPLKRIQFTADLLPADVLGGPVWDAARSAFAFHPGPLFAPLVLADEVNRATPKTQSALLEAMEERRITVDGTTRPLPEPFFVIATQNPAASLGAFPLPESQLDRFLMRLRLGYPDRDAERSLLTGGDRHLVAEHLTPVIDAAGLARVQAEVPKVAVSEAVREYVLDLLAASRAGRVHGEGLSPRAGLGLQRAAQAWALVEGRRHVEPEDVQAVAEPVMDHRLGLAPESGGGAASLVAAVPVR